MCGIAICISSDPVLKHNFSKEAIKLLHHRGPDGNGVWQDDNIIIVHTRLSIQDLTEAGKQPMISQSGRFIITFNGEIYNHLSLRKRFLPDHKFKGHADTETILELFEKMGEKMLPYLIGMWAFAIWDSTEKKLFVCRDRFGQKPLYRVKKDDSFFLASEIKPLLKKGLNEFNVLAASEYLALGNYGHLFEKTFFESVFQILPAHYTIYDGLGNLMKNSCYWKIDEVPYKDRLFFDDRQAKYFRDLVLEVIESQLLSDVPVGAALSGGLDSSIIVSCLASMGKNIPAFTAQFKNHKSDETRYVEAVKRRWGKAVEVIYTPVGELSLENDLLKVVREQEEPFGDPSIMAHGFLVEAAQKAGVKVMLGGQGGDEISMGYPWMYQRAFAYALSQKDTASFWRFISREFKSIPYLRLITAGLFPEKELSLRINGRFRKKKILKQQFQMHSPESSFGRVDRFDGIYLESIRTVGLPHLCQYDDRSTMSRSIEGRMPFLDHRILEFTSRFRPDAFYSNGYSKMIFRKSFRDLLPQEIIDRRDKVGFYTPIEELILESKPWVKKMLMEKAVLSIASSAKLNDLVRSLDKNKLDVNNAILIFRFISFAIWRNLFNSNL